MNGQTKGLFLMQQRMFTRLLAGSLLCACLAPVVARAGVDTDRTSIEERAKGAEKVAVVRVSSTRTEHAKNDYGDDLIYTHAKLQVKEKLKGDLSDANPEMTVEGGTLDGITLKVSDMESVNSGDEFVVFLDREGSRLKPHMRGLGLLKLDRSGRVNNGRWSLDDVRNRVKASQK
jgi:hypothetical protein